VGQRWGGSRVADIEDEKEDVVVDINDESLVVIKDE